MVPDLDEGLGEDLESVVGLGGVGGVELGVDLLGLGLGEDAIAVDEGAVLDVEVDVAEDHCQECCNE